MPNTRTLKMKTEELDRKIGSRVRAIRQKQGITQSVLADHLGITFQQVQKYENGTNRVSSSTLLLISGFLGLSPLAFLVDDAGNMLRTGSPPAEGFTRQHRADLEAMKLYNALPSEGRKSAKILMKLIGDNLPAVAS